MLSALVADGRRWLKEWLQKWVGISPLLEPPPSSGTKPFPLSYRPLERVVLTDQVARTLFGDFAQHRRGERGDEEIGWVLLGIRDEVEATVLATLPAGAQRSAGVAHVHFNSTAQAVASRIVRQWDKRLGILGVAHTHPGSLRHPSDGDYRGDSLWVRQLRGREGVFAIGTADVKETKQGTIASQPEPHRHTLGSLCFSWYALRDGESRYRRLPVALTLGPDVARPLHGLWPVIETHAEPLDRLCRQQAAVVFDVTRVDGRDALSATFPLAEEKSFVRVLLEPEGPRYYVQSHGGMSAVDPDDESIERAVYLILAELAPEQEKNHGFSSSQRHGASQSDPGPTRQRRTGPGDPHGPA